MKYILPFLFSLLLMSSISAQQIINDTLNHDGLARTYLLYIPDSYDGTTAVPLLLNFHGFGSNATEQLFYGDFREIADTANFIIVHPQGTDLGEEPHFNVGGWTVGSTVDDVGFTSSLLDELQATYQIDPNRIYSTGMSNGGYMSFLLACQLSDRIAAIASVTGSMTPETFNDCDPQHPTPVLQIHGTDDGVVPYNGAAWTKSIDEVLNYWINFNNCDDTSINVNLANTDTQDGSTVSHSIYENGDQQVATEHFKIINGGHTWAGTAINFPGTNHDINASIEVWRFLSQYNLEDLQGMTTNNEQLILTEPVISIYPNPTASTIYIEKGTTSELNYEIYSPTGKQLMQGVLIDQIVSINMQELPQGIYFLRINNDNYRILTVEANFLSNSQAIGSKITIFIYYLPTQQGYEDQTKNALGYFSKSIVLFQIEKYKLS